MAKFSTIQVELMLQKKEKVHTGTLIFWRSISRKILLDVGEEILGESSL